MRSCEPCNSWGGLLLTEPKDFRRHSWESCRHAVWGCATMRRGLVSICEQFASGICWGRYIAYSWMTSVAYSRVTCYCLSVTYLETTCNRNELSLKTSPTINPWSLSRVVLSWREIHSKSPRIRHWSVPSSRNWVGVGDPGIRDTGIANPSNNRETTTLLSNRSHNSPQT